ncbi:MAG: glutamate synthase subunit alpha, partial [Gammaproteobacteria bacterium]|nr:glutamate synthase subunit alpha [Gammaproteobacteria bacterium]
LCERAEAKVKIGNNILILSDRKVDADNIAIPPLLATSAVHQHLIRKGLRTESGLVVETGAALEVHNFATLAGYGAEAINPYLAFDTIAFELSKFPEAGGFEEAQKRYIKAVGKGLNKVMSKMGISTYQSYCGAQIFDAVGLSSEFLDEYFTGTSTTIEGAGLDEIALEAKRWHDNAFGGWLIYARQLDVGGDYAFRLRGE